MMMVLGLAAERNVALSPWLIAIALTAVASGSISLKSILEWIVRSNQEASAEPPATTTGLGHRPVHRPTKAPTQQRIVSDAQVRATR